MGWWKKKSDPLSERARALQREIATLEAQIRELQTTLNRTPLPRSEPPAAAARSEPPPGPKTASAPEPIFEELSRSALEPLSEPPPEELYNEMGVRKFDFTTVWRRWRQRWHHKATLNPRLISYLAAGGVQGLQPLRRERRAARNRCVLLAVILLLLLLGTIWMFLQHR